MSKNKKEYHLLLSYVANQYMWDIEDEIKNAVGRYSDGSGCGFGRRDLSYYFNNLNSLKAAVRKIRALPRRIKCEAWDCSNIDDDFDNFPKVSLKGVR